MSLKKPRIHLTGISNIDYKSKLDIKKIFNNFNNFSNNQQKEVFSDEPSTYKSPNPKRPNLYNVSLKDAVPQSGDSLMYAETYRIRNEIKQKKMEKESEKKLRDINSLSKVYNSSQKINQNNEQTTKVEQNSGKKGTKTDEERINYIRKSVSDKLSTHTDIKNIFLLWQKNYLKNQDLSVYDLHQRINELDIPITYNETVALVSYANKRNTNTLNYDEFKNLFFDDSMRINDQRKKTVIPEIVDVNKIKEDNKKEHENKNVKFANYKVFRNDHFITLETMLNIKNSNFLNSMNEINDKENNKNGNCDFITFKKVLDILKIPEKYKNMSIAKSIYNEFKLPDKDLMSYANFIDKCKNLKQPNDFFEFQNNYLNLLTNKLIDNESKRKKFRDILLEEEMRRKEYVKNLSLSKSMDKMINKNICNTENNNLYNYNDEIKNNTLNDCNNNNNSNNRYSTIKTEANNDMYGPPAKRNKNLYNGQKYNNCTISYDNSDTFSHYQPSFKFIDLIHKDGRKYLERYKEGVKEFSPIEVIGEKKIIIPKKDFGGYVHKFKKTTMSCDLGTPGYIDNKERFDRNDLASHEKQIKLENLEKMNKKKCEIMDNWNDIINFQQKISEVKESLGQIKRTKNLFEYENRIIERNKLQ